MTQAAQNLSAASGPLNTKTVTITEKEIVVDRQSLLILVAALDMGLQVPSLPAALDNLREPFFPDEFETGRSRRDFSMNKYDLPQQG